MKSKNPNQIKSYLIEAIIYALVLFGFAQAKAFRKSSIVQKTIYTQIEEIKHIKHFELVTYYFESMLDVAHKDRSDEDNLHVIIPARVSGYIDLEQMNYKIKDTLVTIYLTEPIIDSQVPELDSAKIFNLDERYVAAPKKSDETVISNMQLSFYKARQDALKRAEMKGIRDETRRLGERYLESFFAGLGYKIEFVYLINPAGQDPGEPHNNMKQ